MSSLDEMRRNLAEIRITLRITSENIDDLLREVLKVGESVGLSWENRAEGYTLIPSHEAAVIGLPQLRVGRIGDLLMVWIRAPHGLNQELCQIIGLDAEDLYRRMLAGAVKIAEVFRKYSKDEEMLQISLPEVDG